MISWYQCWEVTRLYSRLKRLYEEGRIDSNGLQNAVNRGWITPEGKNEIENGNSSSADQS